MLVISTEKQWKFKYMRNNVPIIKSIFIKDYLQRKLIKNERKKIAAPNCSYLLAERISHKP